MAPKIEIYTAPNCTYCLMIKSYLKKNGFAFTEVDVAADSAAGAALVAKTGEMGVPQTFIEGELLVGFNKAKMDQLLGLA